MEDKRINLHDVAPAAANGLIQLEKFIAASPLDKKLYHLVKMRASQINGCAYCLNMHSRDAMKMGETAQRLFELNAWDECGLFTEKEKAAFALTEAITLVHDGHVPDDVYKRAEKNFSKDELAALIMGIVAINGWNRIAISTRMPID